MSARQTYRLMTFWLLVAGLEALLAALAWETDGVEVMVGFMASNLFAMSEEQEIVCWEKCRSDGGESKLDLTFSWILM